MISYASQFSFPFGTNFVCGELLVRNIERKDKCVQTGARLIDTCIAYVWDSTLAG